MRLLMVIKKLRDAIKALPELLYYTDEVLFFKGVNKAKVKDTDKEVLSARIREKAHILEKDIYIIGKPRSKHLKSELHALIDLWKDAFPKDDDPTVRWSLEILNSYEKVFGR